MFERAFEHVGDDFHVAVRVRGKALAGRDAVVIQDAQRAEMHMLGVVIVGKRKCEIGIEPAVVEMAAFLTFADIDHWSTSRFDSNTILVITTIVKRLFNAGRLPSESVPLGS